MSSRNKSKTKKPGQPISVPREKQNDTIFLLQNQNEILKLKNQELAIKIGAMQSQLKAETDQLQKYELQCEGLRSRIKGTQLSDDLRLEQERKILQDKIAFAHGNREIMERKIAHIRQSAILEESKLPQIANEKKVIERQVWEQKTKNEGTKIILVDMEEDLEKARINNQLLISQRKTKYGPQQKEISDQIQERLRILKNTKGRTNVVRKNQGAQILNLLVSHIKKQKQKEGLILVERAALRRKILQKRIFLLSLIRRRYLAFIKVGVLQKFRKNFRPLDQQKKFQRILQHTVERRKKNILFRIWRSESIKKQFTRTRYFQVQNTLQTLGKSFSLSNLYATFNTLKYFRKNPVIERVTDKITGIAERAYRRSLNNFFSKLISFKNNQILNQQVQESAKQHSTLLVLSVYFGAWAKLTKQNKTSNRILKFKYFKQLKKLIYLRKKRDLSEMLTIANEKIKEIDLTSATFCHMKKQTVQSMLEQLQQDFNTTGNKNIDLSAKLNNLKSSTKQLNSILGWFKIASYLKTKMEKAFNLWRNQNRKVMKFKQIFNMLDSKIYNDKNFGFAKIQRKRFHKLKLSIADKIQSCEFSYNYLLQQNQHIKGVLDNKLLELEKSKFVNILHRLIRNEKQIKHKYFFKFLRSGYKCWKFKKMYQRVDRIIELRVKVAGIFMMKQIRKEKLREQKITRQCEKKVNKIETKALSLCFGVFQNIKNRNKHLKKILENVFSRNLELNVYNGYGEVKRIYTKIKQDEVSLVNDGVLDKISEADKMTNDEEGLIEMYRNRLQSKEKSYYNRVALAMRKFYIKNSSKRFIHYIYRWKNKVEYEKKIRKFASILERRTRSYMKNKFIQNFFRAEKQAEYQQLKSRLDNFKSQLNEDMKDFENYSKESEKKMQDMKAENQTHNQIGQKLQKKTERMDTIKVQGFRRYWGKVMSVYVIQEWKKQKQHFVNKWKRVYDILRTTALQYNFEILSGEMKEQIFRNKLKNNLSKLYNKKFRNNAGLAFRIWRIVSINSKIEQFKKQHHHEITFYKLIIKKYELNTIQYDKLVNYRIGDRKMRKVFDFLKKYTRRKLQNKTREYKLNRWLQAGYYSEFYRLFNKITLPLMKQNRKANNFRLQFPVKTVGKLFYAIKTIVRRKKTVNKLLINKFIHYTLLNLYEDFFMRAKNYHRYKEIYDQNHRTFCIQKVIETFEKSRKKILCNNIRRWKRNQFEMKMGQNLFKRLTRKAFYNRYEGMFYAWKRQTEAKNVLAYHTEGGEIKKRKVQIQRIEKFLQDLKKQKGLLLQNEDGNFVLSPRFQKKKQQQERKQKNFRYKFVSRLVMSINGYEAPIKAYNNMLVYKKLRQKYRTKAQFVLNHLRKPDLLLAFSTWRKAAAEFRDAFETMERKDLIKILNKQKDKMEMQYSKKLQIDEKIRDELNRYRVFAHQKQKKQKLCVYVLMKHANKVKKNAFRTWRSRANDLKDYELNQLANKGENRINTFQYELRQLQEIERQFLETNKFLKVAVSQALTIAEMVTKITQERDKLSNIILEKNITCESLLQENQELNSKLYLAQKQAMNLLIISGEKP